MDSRVINALQNIAISASQLINRLASIETELREIKRIQQSQQSQNRDDDGRA